MPSVKRDHIPTIVWNAVCIAASCMDVDPLEVFDQNRRRQVLKARQGAIWAIREIGNLSYPEIGQAMNKDHTTIQHAYQIFCDFLSTGTPWAERLAGQLRERLVWGFSKEWDSKKSEGDASYDVDLSILKMIACGASSVEDVARSLSMDKNKVSKIIDRLSRNNVLICSYSLDVQTSENPLSLVIKLTPKGAAVLARSSPPESCNNENNIR